MPLTTFSAKIQLFVDFGGHEGHGMVLSLSTVKFAISCSQKCSSLLLPRALSLVTIACIDSMRQAPVFEPSSVMAGKWTLSQVKCPTMCSIGQATKTGYKTFWGFYFILFYWPSYHVLTRRGHAGLFMECQGQWNFILNPSSSWTCTSLCHITFVPVSLNMYKPLSHNFCTCIISCFSFRNTTSVERIAS